MSSGICELCQRHMFLTAHHLIPKKMHKKYKNNKVYTDVQLLQTANVCRPCHSAIHRIFTHCELACEYNTIDKYHNSDAIEKWINYIQKQPEDSTNRQLYGMRYAK
jgi:hypothetical protein